jgi:hypothetical protein
MRALLGVYFLVSCVARLFGRSFVCLRFYFVVSLGLGFLLVSAVPKRFLRVGACVRAAVSMDSVVVIVV